MPANTPQARQARLVLTTLGSREEAAQLGQTLVEEKLAACATVLPGAQSFYRWQGQIEEAHEALLLLKTGPDQLAALEARLHQLHSYELPEFLVLPVEAGSKAYLDWLHSCLRVP
ncbi:MAG: divalent-cation tolerance protein CutA [Terracidiphilus sp.]|nr:divalent-cation tolerance protein CutA [Terracidiphilus sp.]